MKEVTEVQVWSSLDIVKVLVDIMLPLVVLLLGLWVKQISDKIEKRNKLSQIEIDWRLIVFKELAPKLNEIYCYFCYVGDWRKKTPNDIDLVKRECDRIIYTNRFLWSNSFIELYKKFMGTAFEEHRGPGRDFLFRANVERHRENLNWDDQWTARFVNPKDRVRREEFVSAYDAVVMQAVQDLEIFKR